jgi:hypothetical protein
MTPADYVAAARVPDSLRPQTFGSWRIRRWHVEDVDRSKVQSFSTIFQLLFAEERIGFSHYTLLERISWKAIHLRNPYEVVMEDSREELRKHLPIWLKAKGRVLVTGLGLGCVVRGLLANKQVEHITVIEIDKAILRIVGHEFISNPRVTLIRGDALTYPAPPACDYAWHDIHEMDGDEHLHVLHLKLLAKYSKICRHQGAWNLPRFLKRSVPQWFLL